MYVASASPRRVLALMVGTALAALSAAPPAMAWIDPTPDPVTGAFARAYFEPEGQVSADGRRVVVHGHALCGAVGGELQVAVSLLQQSTLASFRGFSDRIACVEGNNPFTSTVTVPEGRAAFGPGPVQVCALAQVRQPSGSVDYDMWCVFVTLVASPTL